MRQVVKAAGLSLSTDKKDQYISTKTSCFWSEKVVDFYFKFLAVLQRRSSQRGRAETLNSAYKTIILPAEQEILVRCCFNVLTFFRSHLGCVT